MYRLAHLRSMNGFQKPRNSRQQPGAAVAMGGLHARLLFALMMMVGSQPETGTACETEDSSRQLIDAALGL
jgi:hypothetical protein